MIYWRLFLEFFKIGLFSFGGGYATIPFLYALSARYGWFSPSEIVNMLAISQSTPGPIGINMATFVGYKVAGVFGSVLATLGIVLPSVIIICIFARFLKTFQDKPCVKNTLWGLRPAACAMIAYALVKIMSVSLFAFDKFRLSGSFRDLFKFHAILLLVLLFFIHKKFKLKYGTMIVISGVFGAFIFA